MVARAARRHGLILQGTGIAVLYLTIFAAMRLHPLISPGAALAPAGGGDDLLGDPRRAERHGPAVVAALGGFAATPIPDLHRQRQPCSAVLPSPCSTPASSPSPGSAPGGRSRLVGFVGTFGIGFAWGLRSYTPELFASFRAVRPCSS